MTFALSADKEDMKVFLILFTLFSYSIGFASGIKGKVVSLKDCSSSVMVWVSLDKENYHERLLLMHSEVPVGGSFQFYLKPGAYQVRASDQKGCDYLDHITVSEAVRNIEIKMVKK
jgi:hypothetical protein